MSADRLTHNHKFVSQIDGVKQLGINYDCFECPEANSCSFDEYDTFGNFNCAACDVSNTTGYLSICDIDGMPIPIAEGRLSQHTFGDFLDQATSPNDPLFMFHYTNLDRYLMEWQLRNYEDAPYYGYPETGYQNICRLNDTISPDYPFENLFYDDIADLLGDGPYTARDIWDGTTFLDAVYVYDTVLNMVDDSTPYSNDDTNADEDSMTEKDVNISTDVIIIIGVIVAVGALCICCCIFQAYGSKSNKTSRAIVSSQLKKSHTPVYSTASAGNVSYATGTDDAQDAENAEVANGVRIIVNYVN